MCCSCDHIQSETFKPIGQKDHVNDFIRQGVSLELFHSIVIRKEPCCINELTVLRPKNPAPGILTRSNDNNAITYLSRYSTCRAKYNHKKGTREFAGGDSFTLRS